MTELISRQAALAEIDKNREALLQKGSITRGHLTFISPSAIARLSARKKRGALTRTKMSFAKVRRRAKKSARTRIGTLNLMTIRLRRGAKNDGEVHSSK